MKKETIEARIKWLDTKEEQEVLFKVGDPEEDDDDIFYYVDDKKDIFDLMREGNEDFVVTEILTYSSRASREKVYVAGRGEVCFASGIIRTPEGVFKGVYVEIARLVEPQGIGENAILKDVHDFTQIIFENAESLEVVQAAIDNCRERLNENKKV